MKILQVPFSFYPDPVGGTEVYVAGLSRELKKLGLESVIAAPAASDRVYTFEGDRVYRYAVDPQPDSIRELYGEGSESAASSFERILDEERPDIVHLHALTRGVSLRMVRSAKARSMRVVFTYHTPTVTCLRGTMMRLGSEPCNGLMDVYQCSRCTIDGLLARSGRFSQPSSMLHRLARNSVTAVLGSAPAALGSTLARMDLEGGHWTLLRMTELTDLRHRAVRSVLAEVDRVIAVCQWVKDVLWINGVPLHKIDLCRQGLSHIRQSKTKRERCESHEGRLKIAFLGRLDPTKGVHILIQALRAAPEAAICLKIFGIVQDEQAVAYRQYLKSLAASDSRIEFCPPVAADEIHSTLQEFDLLAVPSQWLETGPLVVLEAFGAGVPVIASRLGGMQELVRAGQDGILVEAADTDAWVRELRRLSEDTGIVDEMRKNILSPRTMADAASDMSDIYAACKPNSKGVHTVPSFVN